MASTIKLVTGAAAVVLVGVSPSPISSSGVSPSPGAVARAIPFRPLAAWVLIEREGSLEDPAVWGHRHQAGQQSIDAYFIVLVRIVRTR